MASHQGGPPIIAEVDRNFLEQRELIKNILGLNPLDVNYYKSFALNFSGGEKRMCVRGQIVSLTSLIYNGVTQFTPDTELNYYKIGDRIMSYTEYSILYSRDLYKLRLASVQTGVNITTGGSMVRGSNDITGADIHCTPGDRAQLVNTGADDIKVLDNVFVIEPLDEDVRAQHRPVRDNRDPLYQEGEAKVPKYATRGLSHADTIDLRVNSYKYLAEEALRDGSKYGSTDAKAVLAGVMMGQSGKDACKALLTILTKFMSKQSDKMTRYVQGLAHCCGELNVNMQDRGDTKFKTFLELLQELKQDGDTVHDICNDLCEFSAAMNSSTTFKERFIVTGKYTGNALSSDAMFPGDLMAAIALN